MKQNNDFYIWLHEQANLLRSKEFTQLDIEEIAQQLDDVAASEKRDLRTQFRELLFHLLKLQFVTDMDERIKCRTNIQDARENVQDILDASPSILQGEEDPIISQSYNYARNTVAFIIDRPVQELPDRCPWALKDLLNHTFFPN